MKKSDETVAVMRCDARRQISDMEDKVCAKFEKAEETRHASHRQTENMLSKEKDKVAEVRRLAFKNMAEKMADTEEIMQR